MAMEKVILAVVAALKGGDANWDNGCNTNSYSNKGSGSATAAGSGGVAGGQNGVNGLDNCGVCHYKNVAGSGGAGQGGKGGTSVAESWNSATDGSGGGTDIFIDTCSDVNACSSSGTQACPVAVAAQTSNSFDNVNDVAIGIGGGEISFRYIRVAVYRIPESSRK